MIDLFPWIEKITNRYKKIKEKIKGFFLELFRTKTEKKNILSLTLLQLFSMFLFGIDSIALILFPILSKNEILQGKQAIAQAFLVYEGMRYLGSISLPILAFLFVRWYLQCKSKKKFFGILFALSLISEPLYDLVTYAKFFELKGQSFILNFLLAFFMLLIMEGVDRVPFLKRGRTAMGYFLICIFAVFSFILKTDYNVLFIALIGAYYLAKDYMVLGELLTFFFCFATWKASAIGCLVIHFFNYQKEKEFIEKNNNKIPLLVCYYPVLYGILLITSYVIQNLYN